VVVAIVSDNMGTNWQLGDGGISYLV